MKNIESSQKSSSTEEIVSPEKIRRHIDTLIEKGENPFGKRLHISSDKDYYDRLLPQHWIPSDQKVEEAKSRGLVLGALVYNMDNGNALPLNSNIAQIERVAIQHARRTLRGKELQAEYIAIHRTFMTTILDNLPEDQQELFQTGVVGIRPFTICKRPQACEHVRHAFKEGVEENSPVNTMAEMQDLSETDWKQLIEDDIPSVLKEMETRIKKEFNEDATSKKISTSERREGENSLEPNELQKLRLQIGTAMAKKEWEAVVDNYIKYMDYLPQYVEHRLAVIDLLRRVHGGEIQKMPQEILSVASGPYEEARAHMDFEFLYEREGLEKPDIYNLDYSFSMLKKAENAYEEKAIREELEDYWKIPANVVGDMCAIPIKKESVEMVECSSLDNLAKESPNDLDASIREMVRVLKQGGILRISHKERLPDVFFEKIEKLGLRLITDPHTTYDFPTEFLDKFKSTGSQHLIKRLKQKIGRDSEYILAVKVGEVLPREPTIKIGSNDTITETEKEASEKAEDFKQSLNTILGGTREEFYSKSKKRRGQPTRGFERRRKALLREIAWSLIKDVKDSIAFRHGVRYNLPDALQYRYRPDWEKVGSGELLKDADIRKEIQSLDRPYRVTALKKYAPDIFRELKDEGVISE